MLEGMLTRSNGISFCYRLCDHSSEDLSEVCGHNGTLEWHRGPTQLQTIPCCSEAKKLACPLCGSDINLSDEAYGFVVTSVKETIVLIDQSSRDLQRTSIASL